MPGAVRVAERDGYAWITNFGSDPVTVDAPGPFVVGDARIGAYDVAVVDASVGEIDVSR